MPRDFVDARRWKTVSKETRAEQGSGDSAEPEREEKKLTQRKLCSRRWQTEKRKSNFSDLENVYKTRQTKVYLSRVYAL